MVQNGRATRIRCPTVSCILVKPTVKPANDYIISKNYLKKQGRTPVALKKSQKSLKEWTKQKWRTKSGKKSSETGERYLPTKAIKALSSKEYAATTKKKREDTKKGKQHSKQPKKIAKKTKGYRKT